MIALATRYDVSTPVLSLMLAERLPAMCGSATLAMLVSRTSMNVASVTVRATIHGVAEREASAGAATLFDLDRRFDRHARSEQARPVGVVERDLDRHAL